MEVVEVLVVVVVVEVVVEVVVVCTMLCTVDGGCSWSPAEQTWVPTSQ